MRILVVSDTHGKHGNFDRAVQEAGPIDLLIHLGDVEGGEQELRAALDCEMHIMRGNNDYFTDLPSEEEITFGRYKAFLTHGHMYYVSLGAERILEEGRARGVDFVMFGHTHRPFLYKSEDGITVLNPGSLSYPRQEGRKGSYIIMETDGQSEPVIRQHYLD